MNAYIEDGIVNALINSRSSDWSPYAATNLERQVTIMHSGLPEAKAAMSKGRRSIGISKFNAFAELVDGYITIRLIYSPPTRPYPEAWVPAIKRALALRREYMAREAKYLDTITSRLP